MREFDAYFLMEEKDVIEYAREKLSLFQDDSSLHCKEIGDGNLNYVFRVWEEDGSASVIIKQAGHTARISDEFKLSTNRIRIESSVLMLHHKLAPGLVPDVILYDDVMNCCVMEDLSSHQILRTALLDKVKFPLFVDHVTTFMVNTLLLTSDVVMDHKEKKERMKNYINPELCEITEDLVYSEPFNDYKVRNDLSSLNKAWIEENIYGDPKLRLEAAKLKFSFMTNAQALVHGDLHTGSFFVTKDSTKVIDPEFAFYGPMGYDVGNILANFIFAWCNTDAVMEDGEEKASYLAWIEETIEGIVDQFSSKFLEAWENHATDIMAGEKAFDTWYLRTVLKDSASIAGLELIRRIIGIAKVKDITSITNENDRARAERICLTVGKTFILEADRFQSGHDFLKALKNEASLEVLKGD
ncbi:S-methyl-5-thioribose kinase [Alkalihalobacillus sp. CinArs1]|uniref:S-methyl-5-thioribose kinase n=1 Tax=Alkalihalobacillus sp. CinArs1 TaxID=2995314 RepID=UPI0022DD001A|nr:S-methyl-5-thioribose kinase [Alkalihalobacillus sp. CinArs1]